MTLAPLALPPSALPLAVVTAAGSPAATAWMAICGALVGLGVTVLLVGGRRPPAPDAPDAIDPGGWSGRVAALLERVRREGATGPLPRRAAVAAAVFVTVGLLTRWPVAAFLAAAGTWALPAWWRPDAAARSGSERLEAVAVWTELLRDTLSAAAGLEQAILSTAATAPDPLAEPVATLAARLRDGASLPVALRAFADEVDDPTMDLVVAALVLAATGQARDLTGLLSTLAQAARDQVVLRLRVSVGRARVRTSVRIIMATTLGMIAGLVLLNRGYLAVYDGAEGQLVLLLVGGLFTLAFVWLARIAAIPVPPRILAPAPPGGPHPPASQAASPHTGVRTGKGGTW
jgi:tight adherence protein B